MEERLLMVGWEDGGCAGGECGMSRLEGGKVRSEGRASRVGVDIGGGWLQRWLGKGWRQTWLARRRHDC